MGILHKLVFILGRLDPGNAAGKSGKSPKPRRFPTLPCATK
jgi:hypothetical protein